MPVHDEDLSIGPPATKIDAPLAGTQWTYCKQPKYGATFRANGTLAITTASADSCEWGQWTQDGTNVSFVCNNYWHWTGTLNGDEIKGTWTALSQKGRFCFRRSGVAKRGSDGSEETTEPTWAAVIASGGSSGGDPSSPNTATSKQSQQQQAMSKPKANGACPAGWHEWNGGCYSCVEGDTYVGQDKCKRPCPANSHEWGDYCITCIAGGSYLGNGQCACPAGTNQWNEYCVTCPSDAVYSGGGMCRRAAGSGSGS